MKTQNVNFREVSHFAIRLVAMLALLIPFMVGCTRSLTEPHLDEQSIPLIKYVAIKIYDPVFVAKEMGFFEKHGISVEILYGVGGANNVQAVASGRAETGEAALAALILANQAGLPVQAVLDFQTVFEDRNIVQFYALKSSGIETVEDFAGKRIAVNVLKSSNQFTTIMLLNKHGLSEDSVQWVTIPIPEAVPALLSGQVDVIMVPQPYQAFLETEHGSEVNYITGDYEVLGNRHTVSIFVNRIWAEENPDQARSFVTAVAETEDWIQASPENKQKAAEIISTYTEIDASIFVDYPFPYTEHGALDMESIDFWMGFLKEHGDYTAEWLTPEDIATNRYNALLPCISPDCSTDGTLK